jgi:membrane protein YdbS with pleckstrin-like domain
MLDWFRGQILALLRVPPEPHAPEGKPESTLVFRAGRNFYRWQVLVWALSNFGVVAGLVAAYFFLERAIAKLPWWSQLAIAAGEVLGLLGIVLALPVTFLVLKWQYELRWYIVTDRSLRIRRGVWNVEELTMTFANIQEIRIKSGPIENLLGLANVEVLSAGGGSATASGTQQGHVASFQGVDNAVEIRDLIVARLRAYRDLGLGGGGDHRPESELLPGSDAASVLAGAGAVLQEARALRLLLAAKPN